MENVEEKGMQIPENVEVMEVQISEIEKFHRSQILSIHENLEKLVYDCNAIVITEDDKETYDLAVKLKRQVKQTHIAIESKRKELKQPIIDYGKRLDEFVKKIYDPLRQAELLVKRKMEVYEKKQDEIKREKKLAEEQKQKENEAIENNLRNLNNQLMAINMAKSKNELDGIMSQLDSVVLSDFGDRSAEAGFILNQLKMTCTMASRFMEVKEQEEVVVQEVKKEDLGEPIPDINSLFDEPVETKIVQVEVPIESNEGEINFTPESSNLKEITEPIQSPFEWDIPTTKHEEEVVEKPLEKTVENKNELSDDEIIELVELASQLPLKIQQSIINSIDEYTIYVIQSKYPNTPIPMDVTDLIKKESVNRIGLKLSKYKSN